MIDRKYPTSRKNSMTSLSTVNSSMSTSTTISNVLPTGATPASVRNLSTSNLMTIDDKFVRKSFKRSNSEVNFHKAQGTYYFPNGEVFRPRISPSRRNKPGKINDDISVNDHTSQSLIRHEQSVPNKSNVESNSMYSYASNANSTSQVNNIKSGNLYNRTSSMVSLSNMQQQSIPRSQSSSNVRKMQNKNLAQSLRLNKVDTPTNITLFQQHLNQQHQQHQPGQLPQQYSQQFQQFQQHQHQTQKQQQPVMPQQPSPNQVQQQQFASQQFPIQPNSGLVQAFVQVPLQGTQDTCHQVLSVPVQVNSSNRSNTNQLSNMPGGFPQYTPSNNSSVTSLKTLQSNNLVKSLGILNNNSDNSIEINVKSDSNLLSVSNYTLVRSTSNTPQTSISNSLDEDSKSNNSRPTSGTNESMEDNLGVLKESNIEHDSQNSPQMSFAIKTPESQMDEVFATPLGTDDTTDVDKFVTPQTSPVYEPKDIFNDVVDNEYLSINKGVSSNKSFTSSIYSSDNEYEEKLIPEVISDDNFDSDTTSKLTPIQTPHAFDTGLSSPRTITPIRQEFERVADKDAELSSYSSRHSPFSSTSSHEDVDDLLNDYQNESPASQHKQYQNDTIERSPPKLRIDVNLNQIDDVQTTTPSQIIGREDSEDDISRVLHDTSVPRRGDISVVNERVVRDLKVSASSSFKSLNNMRSEEQMPSPTIKDSTSELNTPIKSVPSMTLPPKAKEEIKTPSDPVTVGKPKLMLESVETAPKSAEVTETIVKPKLMLDVVEKPKLMLDVVEKPKPSVADTPESGIEALNPVEVTKPDGPGTDPKTPTKPKKKPPSGSPLEERIFSDGATKEKSLPSTPKTEKESIHTKSPTPASGKSIWKKMFQKTPVGGKTTENETAESRKSLDFKTRNSLSESRSSSDAKSMNSSYDTSLSSNVTKSSSSSKFKKLTSSKKSFSFKDLKISSFKNHSDEVIPPLPNILTDDLILNKEPVDDNDSLLITEDLTLTKLPSFEAEENIFDDMLITFDEKLDKVGRRATIKAPSLNMKDPFLKDDELTMDQIEDQQLKDKMLNGHSRTNSEDEYIDENLLFLKDELIWPIDTVGDVKSIRSTRSNDEKSKRNSIAVALVASNDSESPLGGEEDVFYIDNEQLNNLFNNISDSQRRKLPMHLKYIKQFKDYNLLEINIKKFENLRDTKIAMKNSKVQPILKQTTRYRSRDSLNSRDRRTLQPPKHKVQFSNKIVVNETFAPDVYSRYNRSVTQYTLHDPTDIARMKHEMNEYKCNEMLVHERSQNNTHFFY